MISTYIILGLGLMILGVLVYKFKMVRCLVGYRRNRNYDKGKLAKWAGLTIIVVGIIMVIANLIMMQLYKITNSFITTINTLIFLVGIFNISYGCERFEVK